MKRRILVIGFGSHGRVVLDLFRQADRLDEVGGFVDAYEEEIPAAEKVEGVRVLGGLSFLERAKGEGHESFLVAVGDNRLRQEITRRALAAGLVPTTVVAPSATIGTPSEIGPGTMVSAGAIVVTGSVLGSGVLVNTAATIDHDNRIGDFVHVAPGAHLGGRVEIGERSMIGIGAAVIQGVRIGKDVTVGAGAAVISDLPDGVTAVGVPARILARSLLALVILAPLAARAEEGRLAAESGTGAIPIERTREAGESDLMDLCLESPVEDAWIRFDRAGRSLWLDVGHAEAPDFVRVAIPYSGLAGVADLDVYHIHPLAGELERAACYYRPLAHGTVDEYRRTILERTPGLYARPPGPADFEGAVLLVREAARHGVLISTRTVVAEGVFSYGGTPSVPFADLFAAIDPDALPRPGGLAELSGRLERYHVALRFDARRRLADSRRFAEDLEQAIAEQED